MSDQSNKDYVLKIYPNAMAEYSPADGWTIDTPGKALNWSNKTEDLAWAQAEKCIKENIDPLAIPVESQLS